MLAKQIWPTTLSAAIVFRYTRFWQKKHRELPFLAIVLIYVWLQQRYRIYCTVRVFGMSVSFSRYIPGVHQFGVIIEKTTSDYSISDQSAIERSERRLQYLVRSVCVVFSSHPFWTSSSLDVPAGVTQEEGHTGFLIHLPSAVRALIFLARRIQPFLSLVDREVEFCVLTN